MIRRTAFFSGHVQGVGFRYSARQIAARYAVSGYVRNLPDGRVEAVVEGDAAEIDRFMEDVSRTMRGHIRETQVNDSEARGEFDKFDIRY